MRIVLAAAVAVVTLAAQPKGSTQSPIAAKQTFHYRLQPRAHALYTYSNAVNLAQTIHVMGMEQAITSSVTFEQDVRTELLDTLVELAIGQRNVRIELKGLEQLGRNDSVITFPELEDYQLRMHCARSGKLISQEFVPLDSGAGSAAQPIRRQAIEQFTGGGVRMRFIVEFPDKPLTPGTQWTQTLTDTVQMPLGSQQVVTTMDLSYTFEGMLDTLGKRCAVVRVESTRYLISGTAEQMGTSVGISGDGALSARYLIEVESGMPLLIETSAQLDQRMTLFDQSNTVIPISIDVRGRMQRRL